MAERVRVREIDDDEGRRLLRVIRRGSGPVVTWRRAQMFPLSAQGMPVAKIAKVTFTSTDRVRDVIHNVNADGFNSLYPKHKGGRPKTFTLPERREIKKIAKSKPAEHGTWRGPFLMCGRDLVWSWPGVSGDRVSPRPGRAAARRRCTRVAFGGGVLRRRSLPVRVAGIGGCFWTAGAQSPASRRRAR